ncbi:hypothetical protein LAZ67_X003644 [Cordylochernes scorpioides]|uniref:Uncharacterized protein n=1 Tax=Cordylochernes scorpioides TaxID=51811 RepID=A0ABY6LUK1_9ARAC|nr:hypothetical protein LAZ67_X003644 [Cordylochernes scorpioides]
MWSMVAQRLTQITSPAATSDQPWQHVEVACSVVPQEHIQSLFESMPRRVAASEMVFGRDGGPVMKENHEIVKMTCSSDRTLLAVSTAHCHLGSGELYDTQSQPSGVQMSPIWLLALNGGVGLLQELEDIEANFQKNPFPTSRATECSSPYENGIGDLTWTPPGLAYSRVLSTLYHTEAPGHPFIAQNLTLERIGSLLSSIGVRDVGRTLGNNCEVVVINEGAEDIALSVVEGTSPRLMLSVEVTKDEYIGVNLGRMVVSTGEERAHLDGIENKTFYEREGWRHFAFHMKERTLPWLEPMLSTPTS